MGSWDPKTDAYMCEVDAVLTGPPLRLHDVFILMPHLVVHPPSLDDQLLKGKYEPNCFPS